MTNISDPSMVTAQQDTHITYQFLYSIQIHYTGMDTGISTGIGAGKYTLQLKLGKDTLQLKSGKRNEIFVAGCVTCDKFNNLTAAVEDLHNKYLVSCLLYISQKQLPRKMKSRFVIIVCAAYIFWQLFLWRLYVRCCDNILFYYYTWYHMISYDVI